MELLSRLALSVAIISFTLNIGLINGQYSPESQVLAQILKHPSLSIPEKFRAQESQITEMRNAAKISIGALLATIKDHDSIRRLLVNKPDYLWAVIQLIQQAPMLNVALALADLAETINNTALFTQAAKMATPESLNNLLIRYITFDLFQNNQGKEFIKIIVNTDSKKEDFNKEAFQKQAYQTIINSIPLTSKNFQGPMDFLLSLGLPINLPASDKRTLLDKVNTLINLSGATYFNELKTYLISKGAKTHAELTPAERGEK